MPRNQLGVAIASLFELARGLACLDGGSGGRVRFTSGDERG
jgi:hypothetical protein